MAPPSAVRKFTVPTSNRSWVPPSIGVMIGVIGVASIGEQSTTNLRSVVARHRDL